jgi:F-type H+-transporting ATPase subunit gamma
MPSTQTFRRRIKSANNTKQITKAMEMISSIQMQKATRTIIATRNYIQNAWNILKLLADKALPQNHPLLMPEKVGKTAVLLITSDRGLCGAYNAEVIKRFVQFTKTVISSEAERSQNHVSDDCCDVIAIGKVGAEYVKKYHLGNLIAEFKGFENEISIEDIVPISKLTNGEYLEGKYDKIVVIYSHFVSSIKQVPVVQQILPINDQHIDLEEFWTPRDKDTDDLEYKFEPDADKLFDNILTQILRSQIFGAVLEANASEHSARMVAMKNATDNATSLIDELKLIYNSIRQDNITREIAEISGAADAMN